MYNRLAKTGIENNNENEMAVTMPMKSNLMNNVLASNPAIAREVATVQTQMIIAQMCPRDMSEVQQRIASACSRLQLASSAIYAYARGGSDIKGASIRLAEALLNAYGNSKAGFEITSQTETESTVRAYAFDMQTNTLMERTFVVPHVRHTKTMDYALTDPRDIYEAVANQSSRRVRACILAIIPSDLQEFAINKCNETLQAKVKITPDSLEKLLESFSAFGISKTQIEDFIQRKLEAITTSQYLNLKQIYASLRDGIAKPEDFFKSEEKIAVDVPKVENSINSPLLKENAPAPSNSASDEEFEEEFNDDEFNF